MEQDDRRSVFSLAHWNVQHRRWRCPSEETLAAFTERRLVDRAAERVRAHLADCEYCLGQVTFLLESEDLELPQVPAGLVVRAREVATRGEPSRYQLWRWRTMAATVGCVALAGSLWLHRKDLPTSPAASDASTAEVVVHPGSPVMATGQEPHKPVEEPTHGTRNGVSHSSVPTLIVPRERAIVNRSGLEFRWTGPSRALFYEVRIVTAEGDLVWEGRADEKWIKIPPGLTLDAGQTYFAWVRAYLPEGKTVQSKASSFSVGTTK